MMKKFYIQKMEDLIEAVNYFGFLPFFENEIEGFSIAEMCDPSIYFTGVEGPWEWKGPVISELQCAYGKFFNKKAGFITKKWFSDFANYRRDGYDFDARFEDGLASYNEEYLYNLIAKHNSLLSKEAKALGGYVKPKEKGKDTWEARKGFDTTITKLQMNCYIVTTNFEYLLDKKGNPYGWGVARYATPEKYLGKTFIKNVYKHTPEESYKKIIKHLNKVIPDEEDNIIKLLG